jgi:D-amino peptidase
VTKNSAVISSAASKYEDTIVKIYISADIEGVAGIAHWDEATKDHAAYQEYREYMTQDVKAACEAALEVGAGEILIKDAHGSGRNIITSELPEEARVIRNWSGHPFGMIQELDDSFAAVAMLGYHAAATIPTNPLSHTLTGAYAKITLNGAVMSEFILHSYIAAYIGVPVVMISGDEGICAAAEEFNPGITTVSTGMGLGASNIGLHPKVARRSIADGMKQALSGDLASCKIHMPDTFALTLRFNNHAKAYRKSFYPGARLLDAETVAFESDNFFEIARMIGFME